MQMTIKLRIVFLFFVFFSEKWINENVLLLQRLILEERKQKLKTNLDVHVKESKLNKQTKQTNDVWFSLQTVDDDWCVIELETFWIGEWNEIIW